MAVLGEGAPESKVGSVGVDGEREGEIWQVEKGVGGQEGFEVGEGGGASGCPGPGLVVAEKVC